MKPHAASSLDLRIGINLLFITLLLMPLPFSVRANESFGFLERFALAEDRGSILRELVPGTEDYYYYSALLAQQEGRLDEVAGFLEPWIKRHGETVRVNEIRHRQALLSYSTDKEGSLAYLKRQLGLRFDHEQAKLDRKPDFPTALNEEEISWESFYDRSISRDSIGQIEDSGLDRLLREERELNPAQRRELLSRLTFPDYERLVGLIAADLRTRESRGFGEFPIHLQLTLAQLDELEGLRPELAASPAFVDAKLLRLRPNGDIDLEHSAEERQAYLDRLWSYVSQLAPAFNSLKVSVLHQRLSEARARGEFPLDEFLSYLQLPRPAAYMSPRYLEGRSQQVAMADLNADFSSTTGFPPIMNDEAIVRHFLEAAFVEDESYQRFSAYLREDYLKEVFAETKLVGGLGDPAEYFSLLTPAQVQSIKERVEISFLPDNPASFGSDDEVVLKVAVKNVSDLLVKVYEINSHAYYLDQQREINTDLNLDGLVANEEKRYKYDDTSMIRHSEVFSFESLSGKRGVWVVELIGNGISSRALVRKGKLQYLSTTTPGGEMIQVLSEENEWVKNAFALFGGKRYDASAEGSILLPFSEAGAASVILSDGEISSLVTLDLPRETYSLDAGFFLEQESLIAGRESVITVRPQLSLNGEPVSSSLLENPTLRIKTTDQDGIESIVEVDDFPLFDDRESGHAFRVPPRLQNIQVTLEGGIPLVSAPGEPERYSARRDFQVNGTDTNEQVFDLFLSRFEEGYYLEVLGKSGEAVVDQPVSLTLTHDDFSRPHSAVLKSDSSGRIQLGPLGEIVRLQVSGNGAEPRQWKLEDGRYELPGSVHAMAGEVVILPIAASIEALSRSDFALFEIRSGVPAQDKFSSVSLASGALELRGLARGDYRAYFRREGKVVDIHVTESTGKVAGYALSGSRHLQASDSTPLYISSFEEDGDKIVIEVKNSDKLTRVHLVATRFLPSFDPYESLKNAKELPLFRISRGSNRSLYVSGRDIGEEYRYILERRSMTHYPGNMLDRPGLLLNPWELNETSTELDEAEEGDAYRKGREMKTASRAKPGAMPTQSAPAPLRAVSSPSLQFLEQPSLVLTNLEPGEDGRLELNKEVLKGRQHLQLMVVNANESASRQLALSAPDDPVPFKDLRLERSFDEKKSYTQQRKVTLLHAGESLTIDDLRSAELEVYDTLSEVYSTLLAINSDPDFTRFGFVTKWPSLEDSEKRRLYAKFASHELHVFLAEKDKDFFEKVVRPYLAHKKDKTFIDRYLLGENLEAFLAPWEFSRLNIVERILLGRRLGGDWRSSTADHVVSLYELIPKDDSLAAFNFAQALRGRRSGAVGDEVAFAMPVPELAYGHSSEDRFEGNIMEEPAAVAQLVARPAMQARGSIGGRGLDMDAAQVRQIREEAISERLFRQIESTREWAENNYFELPVDQQNAELIPVNGFWKDFANWNGEGGFYSREFTAATRNFTEMMFALSVLDLPFEGEEHGVTINANEMQLTARSPLIVFHEEIEEGEVVEDEAPVLVSQNFYRADDRFRIVNGEKEDKFVTDEFLVGVVYGSQVVVTNPTSTTHRLDLLLQIPAGSVPVGGSDYTKSYPLSLDPFSTRRLEVSFYFPKPSEGEVFTSFPAQVAKDEKVIASGARATFNVVERLSNIDEASWDYLSQEGSGEDVLSYLMGANLHRINLSRIAWRMREDIDFFREVTSLIAERHGYDDTLWSYGLYYGENSVAQEYLKHQEAFLRQAGMWIESELVSIDPVDRNWYQHLEYSPLVNARAHRLGRERSILNDRFRAQYLSKLQLLSYKPEISNEDRLAVSAYLFLQDRIEEGLAWQESVEAKELSSTLQYDYLSAYAAFYREDLKTAGAISDEYEDYPVEHWRRKFAEVSRQLTEVTGKKSGDKELPDGETLSSGDPFLELSAAGREGELNYHNIEAVTVNYYEMDLEFLFSSKPFVSGDSGQFAYVKPNRVEKIELPEGETKWRFEIPEEFASKNVLVETVGAGQKSAVAVFSNRLDVQLAERYGRLEVRGKDRKDPLSKIYVKVYAKMKNGDVQFFKDGYTDLRGKFDYASLSTNDLDEVESLSLLVMSEKDGALVREVKPPQR
ncbi:MAG: hypothetical protein P1U68_10960 [Verrucomicrobiales bacterium]|nr:hypothetical protein [Verrucomicrobiales bacterium]